MADAGISRTSTGSCARLSCTYCINEAACKAGQFSGCTKKEDESCTSLQQVQRASIYSIIKLKRESKCEVLVTGGTEWNPENDKNKKPGVHANGEFSHRYGFKIDLQVNPCLYDYIRSLDASPTIRGDGAMEYKTSDELAVYAYEPKKDRNGKIVYHWDNTFYPPPQCKSNECKDGHKQPAGPAPITAVEPPVVKPGDDDVFKLRWTIWPMPWQLSSAPKMPLNTQWHTTF